MAKEAIFKIKIPEHFALGGVEHTVETLESLDDGDFGLYDPVCKRIQVAKTSRRREVPLSFQQQTFFHELVHAILNTMRKDDLYDDESFVNTFASFLNEAVNTME